MVIAKGSGRLIYQSLPIIQFSLHPKYLVENKSPTFKKAKHELQKLLWLRQIVIVWQMFCYYLEILRFGKLRQVAEKVVRSVCNASQNWLQLSL